MGGTAGGRDVVCVCRGVAVRAGPGPSLPPSHRLGSLGLWRHAPAPLTGPRKPNNFPKDAGKIPRASVYLYTQKATCGPNVTFVQF